MRCWSGCEQEVGASTWMLPSWAAAAAAAHSLPMLVSCRTASRMTSQTPVTNQCLVSCVLLGDAVSSHSARDSSHLKHLQQVNVVCDIKFMQ